MEVTLKGDARPGGVCKRSLNQHDKKQNKRRYPENVLCRKCECLGGVDNAVPCRYDVLTSIIQHRIFVSSQCRKSMRVCREEVLRKE